MHKKFILITIIIIITSSLVIFAKDNIKLTYEGYESNIKILFNDKEVKFDLPIIMINGHTYIPLRETAQKANVNIAWIKEKNEILLNEDFTYFDIYKVFETLFEFKLSDKSKISEYSYTVKDEKPYLYAKISIDKKDVEFIKNFTEDNKWESVEHWNCSPTLKSICYWWDLSSLDETILSYRKLKTGINIKTCETCLFITEGLDNKYYLYAIYD